MARTFRSNYLLLLASLFFSLAAVLGVIPNRGKESTSWVVVDLTQPDLKVKHIRGNVLHCEGGYDGLEDEYQVMVPNTGRWLNTKIPVTTLSVVYVDGDGDGWDAWLGPLTWFGKCTPGTTDDHKTAAASTYQDFPDAINTVQVRYCGPHNQITLDVQVTSDRETCLSFKEHVKVLGNLWGNSQWSKEHLDMHRQASESAQRMISRISN